MLMDLIEIEQRLNSPNNLMNVLAAKTVMSTSVIPANTAEETISPEALREIDAILGNDGSPSVDDLVPDALDKIQVNLAQSKALSVLNDSLDQLKLRLVEVEKPKELSRIASDMGKIINSFTDKNEDKKRGGNVIIYKPAVAELSNYSVVRVNE